MSQNTALPPEGPRGPPSETTPEKNLLLSDSHDACDNPGDSPAPEEEAPGDPPETLSVGRGTARGEDSTNGLLVRTQPQRLPQPTASMEPGGGNGGDGGAGQSQNGRRVALSNGARPEPRRHPSSTVSHKVQRKLQSSLSVHSDSSRKSRAGSAHKPGSSPEDCCVHCILACLFCEFLALCNMVVAQASCGACGPEACCCCCGDELGDDCNCPCDMDCGIMDACCESSDCLEICMECCGICFPT